jgi:hypothetical protein
MGWEWIETAPRTIPNAEHPDEPCPDLGPWVLVACRNRGEWTVTKARWAYGKWEQVNGGLNDPDGGEFLGEPSHWQWLPDPPTA